MGSYSKNKGRSNGPRYFGLPYAVTEHPNFVKLSAHGNKLLIDIGRQYFGTNNGDLCATWSLMSQRGWKSKETLTDALRELEHYALIVVTQYGHRKKPTLYALTWLKIDKATGECKDLIDTLPGSWKLEKKQFVKPSAKRASKKSVGRYAGQTGTECGVKRPHLGVVK